MHLSAARLLEDSCSLRLLLCSLFRSSTATCGPGRLSTTKCCCKSASGREIMQAPESSRNFWRPSSLTLWAIFLGVAVLAALAFFSGYFPLQERRAVIAAEAR